MLQLGSIYEGTTSSPLIILRRESFPLPESEDSGNSNRDHLFFPLDFTSSFHGTISTAGDIFSALIKPQAIQF